MLSCTWSVLCWELYLNRHSLRLCMCLKKAEQVRAAKGRNRENDCVTKVIREATREAERGGVGKGCDRDSLVSHVGSSHFHFNTRRHVRGADSAKERIRSRDERKVVVACVEVFDIMKTNNPHQCMSHRPGATSLRKMTCFRFTHAQNEAHFPPDSFHKQAHLLKETHASKLQTNDDL